MKDFFNRDAYNLEDIQFLIRNQIEESIYLDFKEARALEKGDDKIKAVSKVVSSFANSDGGIVVYGVAEKDHKASEITFINGKIYTKEWLEQIINTSIQRRVPNILIYPIRAGGDLEKSIYIVKIPASNLSPHLSKDNKFYRRYNFMSVPMEEYEVRNSYMRSERTALNIEDVIITESSANSQGGNLRYKSFFLAFQVANLGNVIENQFKLEIYIDDFIINLTSDNPISEYFIRGEGNTRVFSIPNKSPLFQGEITTVCNALIDFNCNTHSMATKPIRIKLYYSSGVLEKVIDLSERYLHKGKPLREWSWV